MSFSQFNIDKILTHGASLLGSEGVEYDAQELGESSAFIVCRMEFNKTIKQIACCTHNSQDLQGNWGLNSGPDFVAKYYKKISKDIVSKILKCLAILTVTVCNSERHKDVIHFTFL